MERPYSEKIQYLVFADIEYAGFLIGIYDNYSTTEIIMDKIWALGDPPSPFLMEDLVTFYSYLKFDSYRLTEDNMFEYQSIDSRSNGYYTVGIVELKDGFTVESYLRARNAD